MDSPRALQEEIICPLCCSVFNNPRTLHCLHSYCEDCLFHLHRSKHFSDTLDCPECRHVTSLEEEGIHGLKVNFKLKRFVEILSAEEKREIARRVVSRPVPPIPAPRTSLIKPHPSGPSCDQHSDKELEYYCTQCKALICSQCMLETHRFHRDPIAAKDALKEKLEALKAILPQANSVLEKAETAAKKLQEDKDALWRNVEMDVSSAQEYFQKIRSILDEREMEVCKNIEARATRHQGKIEKQRKLVYSSMSEVQKSAASIQQVVDKRPDDVNIIAEERSLTQKLDTQMQHLSLLIDKAKEKPRTTYQTPFAPNPEFETQCKIVGLQSEPGTPLVARHTFVGSVTPKSPRKRIDTDLSQSCNGSPDLGVARHRGSGGTVSDFKIIREIEGATILTPSAIVTSASILGPTHSVPNNAHPFGVCIGSANTLVVTDSKNHMLSILTPTGKFLSSTHMEGSKDGQLLEPVAVSCDKGKIKVVDRGQPPRVQVFSDKGTFLSKLKVRGGLAYCCLLGEPLGLVSLDDGTLLVSDSDKSCVHVYEDEGKYLGKFGDTEMTTKQPAGMAMDSRGNVFISDRGHHCVFIYTCGGSFVAKIGKNGSSPGKLNYPYGVAIDKKGNIFISESGNHRISMFKPGGKFVCCFGKKGSEPGMFLYPRHLCVDSQGRLVVADEQNHRLQIFDIPDSFNKD